MTDGGIRRLPATTENPGYMYYNFLCILKTKAFAGMKVCQKFALLYLEIIVKDQLYRIVIAVFEMACQTSKV